MFLPDMASANLFGCAQLKAIGWLGPDHEYARGRVPAPVFLKLCQLIASPWRAPVVSMGIHPCSFCRFTGGGTARYQGIDVPSASSMELFIPSTGFLYFFPENIAHYIDSHGYCPPEGFQRAVLDCPPMKSMEYRKLLLANGGRLLVQPGESRAARQPSVHPSSQ